ncbi:MAG TPA: FtsK/SpoIIIE domain-containing protein [Verrucomicrobiota bacterium]|nr:FtsK/SpoIIIE domain-containing protein [Verrucomicrobiota bacterium]
MNESSTNSEPTANDRLLSATQTLELLNRLRDAIREVTSRAGSLEADFTSRFHKLRAQHEQAVATARDRWGTATDNEGVNVANRRSHAQAVFERRKAWISTALDNARKQRFSAIESDDSRRGDEIQQGHAKNDRQRDDDTRNNQAAHEAFHARLETARLELEREEVRAWWTVGGRSRISKLAAGAGTAADASADAHKLLERLQEATGAASAAMSRCSRLVLPLIFRCLPLWLWVLVAIAGLFAFVPEVRRFDFQSVPVQVWKIAGGGLAAIIALWIVTRLLTANNVRAAAAALVRARQLHDEAAQKADATFAAENARIQTAHATATQALNALYKQTQRDVRSTRKDWEQRLNEQARHLIAENEERHRRALVRIEADYSERMTRHNDEVAAHTGKLESENIENNARLNAALDAARASIKSDWQNVVLPLYNLLQSASKSATETFPPWRGELWENFSSPDDFAHAARFAELAVDLERFCSASLKGEGFSLPDPARINAPLLLSIPRQASVLFETKTSGQELVIGALNNLVLRLLTSAPPGRLAFTIFDPVGLGQNFAGIMHLADFEERIINSRIWTQQAQFEQRLADLNEHIEKVTQMYLRNEYETLAEYNEQAGRMAEKYHFLVIADFPVNFSEVAVKRLQSIAASGPRCGVHLLIHWDQRKPAPVEFVPDELRKNAMCIVPKGDGFAIAGTAATGTERRSPDRLVAAASARRADTEIGAPIPGTGSWDGVTLSLDAPPDAELATKLLQKIGKDSTDSYRVEMPFVEVAPDDNEIWSLDTTTELRVPVGRTGATKLQYLALGQGTRQHGLIAGKTGSGKSTLFHVIVTNLSLWCSPDEVEFYLVDFKKGVEFKCYATHKLPHARVIAIESDREFGLSVLQRVDDELKRRGDLFRKLGAQDIAGYKRAGGNEPMPRVLLLIDEFQELFVEDDRISQGAALLLDRIVRQGRAFGIHVLLGSQTLGGAYSLARATIGQMVVRIALQCNEADAYLIMSEDNPAPRLLSRPGEAIYNDDGGALQGNSPFQVVWLPDRVRDEWLDKVSSVTKSRETAREPIVFEGNAPANVRDNPLLRSLLSAQSITPTVSQRVWLGAPNSIKGPTEAMFQRQSGNNLLITGQREEAALAMLAVAQISLAAQHAKGAVRLFVFDCSPPDSPEARLLQRVAHAAGDDVRIVSVGDTEAVIGELAMELERRNEQPGVAAPATFVLVHGLQRNKKLRFDEEASFSMDTEASARNPGLLFNKLICEGAAQGIHVIATCDTYNNVMRMLSRKALSEFEMRVVFQMSANDSASLIDSPLANNLGLHRAILFNGQQGWMETFRPYALPDEGWLNEVIAKLEAFRSREVR